MGRFCFFFQSDPVSNWIKLKCLCGNWKMKKTVKTSCILYSIFKDWPLRLERLCDVKKKRNPD